MKIMVVQETKGFNYRRFILPYNTMSKNILRLLYPIYKNHLIYIVKENKCDSCDFTTYEEVVVLTYEEFLNSEV